uniref:ULP_PROTEASE domain-containing protein n=1 Tax=Steinernema glaseri TaxID=37863 RepID=A0A1I7Y033_9BILA
MPAERSLPWVEVLQIIRCHGEVPKTRESEECGAEVTASRASPSRLRHMTSFLFLHRSAGRCASKMRFFSSLFSFGSSNKKEAEQGEATASTSQLETRTGEKRENSSVDFNDSGASKPKKPRLSKMPIPRLKKVIEVDLAEDDDDEDSVVVLNKDRENGAPEVVTLTDGEEDSDSSEGRTHANREEVISLSEDSDNPEDNPTEDDDLVLLYDSSPKKFHPHQLSGGSLFSPLPRLNSHRNQNNSAPRNASSKFHPGRADRFKRRSLALNMKATPRRHTAAPGKRVYKTKFDKVSSRIKSLSSNSSNPINIAAYEEYRRMISDMGGNPTSVGGKTSSVSSASTASSSTPIISDPPSESRIEQFKEFLKNATPARRSEEVGSDNSSGRSTPSVLSSLRSSSVLSQQDDKNLSLLDALSQRQKEYRTLRYSLERRAGETSINRLTSTHTVTEAGYRTKSRAWKEVDQLENDLREKLKLGGVIIEREKAPPKKDDFPEIPTEGIELIGRIWNGGSMSEVFAKGFGADITRKDLMTLKGLDWLNDEVINFYMNLICERSTAEGDMPKVYAFNTFFYPNLTTKGFASVRRWTRKLDIFSYNVILVPVHLGAHWCLAVIDMDRKTIDYYDSMLGNNNNGLEKLREYLALEMKDKKKEVLDTSEWRLNTRKDIPRQMNGSDCGMFTCKFAEYASRRADINFTQNHMPYFRQRMVHEICSKQLM